MQCPSCGAALVEASGAGGRCVCGWDVAAGRKAAFRLLGMGVFLDFLGTILVAYLFLANMAGTPWIGVAGALMAAGVAMIVMGALKLSGRKT